MVNKEIVERYISRLDSKLKAVEYEIKRGTRQDGARELDKAKALLSEISSFISREKQD